MKDNAFKYETGLVHYNTRGEGHVIVLLHGYLESKEVWESFAERLSSTFKVICMDLPGHGMSEIYSESHTMEFMASSVKSLLDNLNIDKVFLAGHSLGGYVTLAFLEQFPGMLSGYCLFHSQPFSDSEAAIDKRKREIKIVKAGKKNLMYPDNIERMFAKINLVIFHDALERSKTIASKIPGTGIIAVLNGMMARPSRLKVMEDGRVPCLWILGTMDSYIPVEVTSKVNLPSNAEIVILNESGHMGFIEQEDESVKVFTAFAEKL